ncbi:MAG: hypothetical protein Q9219_005972 [cf. Caloplaca sp. 3 TL-2023]
MITDAPGPPTIQPGIPALQPSIPTSGVASLSIPPAHQTSSSKSFGKDSSGAAPPQISLSSTSVQDISPTTTSTIITVSATVGIALEPIVTTTSIPFLSDLMSQLFSQSTTPDVLSTSIAMLLSPISSSTSTHGTPSSFNSTTQFATPPAIYGNDPKDAPSTFSTNPVLVYSIQLPPYSEALDTNEISETTTVASLTKDNTYESSAIVYSYGLPRFIPKTPMYVATSARTAAVTMTTGAPGTLAANAPTTSVFLPQSIVDPTKDLPAITTSTILPLYSPACLGNAYGGGYVITPTLFVVNPNATSIRKIPPVYGFSYKIEPTQSPVYSAAVTIVGSKTSVPTENAVPTAESMSNATGAPEPPSSSPMTVTTRTLSISTNAQFVTSQALVTLSVGSFMSTHPPQASRSTVPPGSTLTANGAVVQTVGTMKEYSCTTITTLATSSYLINAAGSTLATLSLPNHIEHVVMTLDGMATSVVNAPSLIEQFGLELNSTIILPANGLETAVFRGAAIKLKSSVLRLIITISCINFMANYF